MCDISAPKIGIFVSKNNLIWKKELSEYQELYKTKAICLDMSHIVLPL